MNSINTDNLAMKVCDESMKILEVIRDKFPDIRDVNPVTLQGENADIIGALFKNSIGEAEYVCRNGRAIVQCVEAIQHIDHRVGVALLIGGAALCIGGYLLYKMNQKDEEIRILSRRISALEETE